MISYSPGVPSGALPTVSPTYYCFVVIALRRPSGCRLHGFKIRVEGCGSKRRTVVSIKPFLSLLAIINQIRIQPRDCQRAFSEYWLSSLRSRYCSASRLPNILTDLCLPRYAKNTPLNNIQPAVGISSLRWGYPACGGVQISSMPPERPARGGNIQSAVGISSRSLRTPPSAFRLHPNTKKNSSTTRRYTQCCKPYVGGTPHSPQKHFNYSVTTVQSLQL
jgi:hypothetical protein